MLDSLRLSRYRSPPMPNWLGKCLCLIAALGVLDGHLMLAQTWAWASMLQERSSEQGISGAINSTFSGEAPCPMCCSLQKERQKQEKNTPLPELKPTAKFPPALMSRAIRPFNGEKIHTGVLREPRCSLLTRWESPPSPPPQGRA